MENVPLTPTIDQFCVDYLSGLSEEHIEFSLSPNPASDLITVILGSSFHSNNDCIEMFDFTGKRLFQLPISSSEMKLDLTSYSKGVYFIKIGQAGKKIMLK
jgi:hypothetical protein